jgi:hypothetical protein
MESWWTLKTSERDFRGQNSLACDVLYIIEKLLKLKCLKWARIAIWTSETQVMAKRRVGSQNASLTPDKKSQESTRFTCLQIACDIPLESS